ncbi:MAG: AAA family ATPase [Planctomycetota bacterium]
MFVHRSVPADVCAAPPRGPAMKQESTTVRGLIERLYCSKPNFSAGVLRTDDDEAVRFRGKFCMTEGECVTLTGHWDKDPKFGEQFYAESVTFDLPDTNDGLVQYLAKNPAFKGIGEASAERIVRVAGTADALESMLGGDLEALHAATHVPKAVLETLRDAWRANAEQNRIRTYLASFGLTNGQMNKLIDQFGQSIVAILKSDPYQLIEMIEGYGFKRVDDIARKFGVPKDHPGRIDAGLLYVLRDEMNSGHTWTGGLELVDLANTLLALDGLDSRSRIQERAKALIADGRVAVDGRALSTPTMAEAETLIRDTFRDHAWRPAPVEGIENREVDLQGDQLRAFETALQYPISVISGGAGTGKTYTVARLTAAFMAAGLNVALCAPTGKAAKRIEELLEKYQVALPAQTLHRLLCYDGHAFNRSSLSFDFEAKCNKQRGYQAVILDEGSMTDVPLMAELLKRIDFSVTRLVIVGDHNQLPPVGPGNVLRDVLAHKLAPTVVLQKVHRQAGILKVNSNQVLAGKVAPSAGPEQGWWVLNGCREPSAIQTQLRDLFRDGTFKNLKLDPLRDVQIITPTHKGPLGTREVNRMLQFLHHGAVQGKFAVGDKVIQTSNDYELDVMNGTLGFVTEITGRDLMVSFDGGDPLLIQAEKTQNLQLAYCMTAHKAQGSEFPCIVVLCHKSHFFADRNWLYTAVTRASTTCILLGDRWGLNNTASKNRTILRRTLLSKWAADGAAAAKPVEVSA